MPWRRTLSTVPSDQPSASSDYDDATSALSELSKKPMADDFTEETKEMTTGPAYIGTYAAGSCSSETQPPDDNGYTYQLQTDTGLIDTDTEPSDDITTELQVGRTTELQTMASIHTVTPGQDSEIAPGDSFSDSCYEGDGYCKSSCSFCSTSDSSSSASPHTDLEQSDSSDGDGFEYVSAIASGTEKHPLKDDTVPPPLKDDTVPPPLFAKEWQTSVVFTKEGGCLIPSHSDVVLNVPQGAVPDAAVEVRAAVCADVAHIRHVLGLTEEEEVVSPLAEFWAGEDYRFQRPVCVRLPHCLPADPDPDRVQVYHVTRSQSHVLVSRLTRQAGDGHGHDSDITPAVGRVPDPVTLPGVPAQEQLMSPVHSPRPADTEHATPSEEVTQELGTFRIWQGGVVTISTDTFCGYVCVHCHKKEENTKPQLSVMGCVTDSCEKWVKISAHVWDARLKIKDFRKKFGIEPGDSNPLSLLDNIGNSKLYMRLRLPGSPRLRHREDEDGDPLRRKQQEHNIPSLLSCKKCIRRGKIRPISSHWIVEPRDGQVPTSDELLAVDVTHVVAGASPLWENRSHLEDVTMVDVKVPQTVWMNHRDGNTPTQQWKRLLQELSTAKLGQLAEMLGVPDGLPGDDNMQHAEAHFRGELIQKIIREVPTKFIPVLDTLLSQVSLSQTGEQSDDSSTAPMESDDFSTSPQVMQVCPCKVNGSDRSPDETTPKTYDIENDQPLNRAVQETQKDLNMSESQLSSSMFSTKRCSSAPDNRLSEENSVSSMYSSNAGKQTVDNSHRRLNVSGGRSSLDEAISILDRTPIICYGSYNTEVLKEDRCVEELTHKQIFEGSQELNDLSSCPSGDMAADPKQGPGALASATEQPDTAGQASRASEERKDGQTTETDGMEEYFNVQRK